MDCISEKPKRYKPRIIIHGGAGNISRAQLPFESYRAYRNELLAILSVANTRLLEDPGATALDVATWVVSQQENGPLWNCGKGAVYTTAGTHELEASVMVSEGYRKRGVGVMQVRRTKHPILLARELLVRGEVEDGGGALSHCQLTGETCDGLARQWGLEQVKPSYFWTKRRWDEHRKALGLSHDDETYEKHRKAADDGINSSPIGEDDKSPTSLTDDQHLGEYAIDETSGYAFTGGDPGWDGKEYLSQGTVGCVVLDSTGTLCVATSTGGRTNKLPGRIGDTPTIGAGFFAESWTCPIPLPKPRAQPADLAALFSECLPGLSGYMALPRTAAQSPEHVRGSRAVALSGTGNGDSFLRLAAARTAAAMFRYGASNATFQHAVSAVAGPNGSLQQSAGDRWQKTGEGEGGMIGIGFDSVTGEGRIVDDFNCGGMFRAWVDDSGKEQMRVFRGEY
ncbi:N-terminal nucleophile aminohydrolase [Polychaeton citri CBS 116435]|uniref:N-terminal nucleophile aminohydrolase n=1 Tax=Polychaeton citri CBS 116435 TaxID=1314669 RepID=A0A9P4QJQ4_9PEZI|nr:N-terminal nucleophile aminohydrolase [Polychaeton citri CBS 116435]